MKEIIKGQCGLCLHFGEHSERLGQSEKLIQIRESGLAEEPMLAICGHPTHESLHLLVSSISGCDAFQMANPTARSSQ